MLTRLALISLAALAVPQLAGAAASCADRTPAAITLAAAASRKCQEAIAKAGAKFVGTQVKTLGKCKTKQPAGTCPLAADVTKIEKAYAASAKTINKACGDDTVQAGLASAYAAESDDAVISSCMLSQHNVAGELIVAESYGVTTEAWPATGKERATCVKEIGKQGEKFFAGAIKAAGKCLTAQSKLGTAGDLSPICLGSFAAGAFVPPTDLKAANALAKAVAKAESSLTKKCAGAASLQQIETIFACPGATATGATTIGDLQKCILCNGLNGMMDVLEQQYAESGSFVEPGPGALQAAVSAAAPGDKLLIGSGTYQEEVQVTADNLALVGCGAATNDRPRIIPPSPQVTGRGIRSGGVDGLLFQSLDFFDQNNDHIFVANADGVTFRDITGDGNRNTRYAVFPILSNNVLVELCKVEQQDDAPIYVGQSSGIVVRHNDVRRGVAAIEIENSGNAQVFGNYATGNTAGLLVFKDPALPVQLSECHAIHHNVFENNNEPNFGTGTVGGVPTGSGALIISADTTPYSYNIARGNNSYGLVFTTSDLAFGPNASEKSVDGNYVFNNWLTGNGASPDPVRWQVGGFPLPGVDIGFVTSESSGNCESGNIFVTELNFGGFASVTPPNVNAGTCVLPPPAVFPGCPAPPVGSPSGAFVDGPAS